MTRRRAGLVGAVLAALLLAAGCGDDGSGGEQAETPTTGAPTTTAATAAAVPSPGCGAGDQRPVTEEERTLTVGGTDRRYLLTVPPQHDGRTPVPLVLDFHGLLEGADVHTQMSGSSAVARDEGYVVVFPHGTGDPLQWNLSLREDNPDLAYFDAVLDEVESSLCIDEARVYSTGLSMGAMFTTVLLCTRADVLAAAAPVAGLLDPEGCEPSRPVPILAFHGTADPILHFNGGVDTSSFLPGGGPAPTTTLPPADLDGPGYPANVAAWAERNGCEPEPTDTDLTDEVVQRVYDCPPGQDVVFDIVEGGGHAWPGSEFSRSIESVVGTTTFDIDATRDGWAFLSQFTDPAAG